MIVIAGLVTGIAVGSTTALRRGGTRMDALQYAAGYGIAFTLLGLFIAIMIDRSLQG